MPEGFVATPCRAMRAVPHADSVWSSQIANMSVSRSSIWPMSEARGPLSLSVADAEGKGRAEPVAPVELEVENDDSTEILLIVELEVGNDDSTEILLLVALEVGNDDSPEILLPVELKVGPNDITEIKLPVYEKLAEADAQEPDEPRLFEVKHPVGVIYAIDEAFVKAVL